MKKYFILVLLCFVVCGCNKKEKQWYDFIINNINSQKLIKCEYSNENSNDEKIIFIYEESGQVVLKNAFFFQQLPSTFELEKYKNDNNAEVIEKDNGVIIVYKTKSTLSLNDEKSYHEILGATCNELDTN